jgi:hypothetical protein
MPETNRLADHARYRGKYSLLSGAMRTFVRSGSPPPGFGYVVAIPEVRTMTHFE